MGWFYKEVFQLEQIPAVKQRTKVEPGHKILAFRQSNLPNGLELISTGWNFPREETFSSRSKAPST